MIEAGKWTWQNAFTTVGVLAVLVAGICVGLYLLLRYTNDADDE